MSSEQEDMIASLHKQLADKEAELKKLQNAYETLEVRLELSETSMASIHASSDKLRQRLRRYRQERTDAEEKAQELEVKLTELQTLYKDDRTEWERRLSVEYQRRLNAEQDREKARREALSASRSAAHSPSPPSSHHRHKHHQHHHHHHRQHHSPHQRTRSPSVSARKSGGSHLARDRAGVHHEIGIASEPALNSVSKSSSSEARSSATTVNVSPPSPSLAANNSARVERRRSSKREPMEVNSSSLVAPSQSLEEISSARSMSERVRRRTQQLSSSSSSARGSLSPPAKSRHRRSISIGRTDPAHTDNTIGRLRTSSLQSPSVENLFTFDARDLIACLCKTIQEPHILDSLTDEQLDTLVAQHTEYIQVATSRGLERMQQAQRQSVYNYIEQEQKVDRNILKRQEYLMQQRLETTKRPKTFRQSWTSSPAADQLQQRRIYQILPVQVSDESDTASFRSTDSRLQTNEESFKEISHKDFADSFFQVQQALVHIAAVTLCWITGMIVSTKDEHVLLEIVPEHFIVNMYARRDCNAAPVSAINTSQTPLSLVCGVGEIIRDWITQFSGYELHTLSYVTRGGVGFAIPHQLLTLQLANGARTLTLTPEQIKEFSENVGSCPMEVYQKVVRVGKKSSKAKPPSDAAAELTLSIRAIAAEIMVPDTLHEFVMDRDLTVGKQIGRGGASQVYLGTASSDQLGRGKQVAVKMFHVRGPVMLGFDSPEEQARKQRQKDEAQVKTWNTFFSELVIHHSFQESHTVDVLGFCLNPLCIVLEYAPAGDLYYHYERHKMSFRDRMRLAHDIALGMCYLHTLTPPVLHNDLKSPNIFVRTLHHENGGISYEAVIGDMGLARRIYRPVLPRTRLVGNPMWLAPECIRGESFDQKADVYAFGIILHELATMRHPFDDAGVTEIRKLGPLILEGRRPTLLETDEVLESCRVLMQDCFGKDPASRPSFPVIVRRMEYILEELPRDSSSPNNEQRLLKDFKWYAERKQAEMSKKGKTADVSKEFGWYF